METKFISVIKYFRIFRALTNYLIIEFLIGNSSQSPGLIGVGVYVRNEGRWYMNLIWKSVFSNTSPTEEAISAGSLKETNPLKWKIWIFSSVCLLQELVSFLILGFCYLDIFHEFWNNLFILKLALWFINRAILYQPIIFLLCKEKTKMTLKIALSTLYEK